MNVQVNRGPNSMIIDKNLCKSITATVPSYGKRWTLTCQLFQKWYEITMYVNGELVLKTYNFM